MELNAIISHEHTDFDAVGSQLGAAKIYPDYTPILPRQVNRNVSDFLTLHWDALPFKRVEDVPPAARIRRLVLVETQTLPSIRGLDVEGLESVIVIDHHERSPNLPAEWEFEGRPAGACTTLLVEVIADRRIALSPVEATLLLLGIYEDTGSLTYAGTTPLDLRAAAWLIDHGANLDILRDFLDHPLTDEQRTLYEQLIDNARLFEIKGYKIIIATAETDEYVEEISTLAHSMRDLYDPDALFLAAEMHGHIQLVARSTTDAIDVGDIMEYFNGGGHTRAAAAFVDEGDLTAVVEDIKQFLRDRVQPAVTVGDIMSRGLIRMIPIDHTIERASQKIRRWGHEGFPVVRPDGSVAGVLTRRDVDRALHHHMGDEPVTTVMHKGNIQVTPDDSVEYLQRVMLDYDVGQVAVVEDNSIVGIVTRTDLLKLWATPEEGIRREEIIRRLEQAVPPAFLKLVRTIAKEANELGDSLYFVGGFVRDLLLNQPTKDLDLVVEGDAIRLGRRLANTYGGRIVGHRRFGTAKWILTNSEPRNSLLTAPGVPDHIDLVTARTEFYEQPTALPQVEQSNIKLDLHRRDFTINTLAIALDEARYGQLLDFYGGERDLRDGKIRVLHNLSFVEDPTRIIRAVRFEQRLAFTIEPRTLEKLHDAIELLDRVSGDRLRTELELIFQEEAAGDMLRRLDELEVLGQINPALTYSGAIRARLDELPPGAGAEVYFAAWLWDIPQEDVNRIAERLNISASIQKLLKQVFALRDVQQDILDAGTASETVTVIEEHARQSDAARIAAQLTESDDVEAVLHRYLEEWQYVEPAVSGERLRELGVPPGPIYAEILQTVRNAILDGEVSTPGEQAALLKRCAEEHQAELTRQQGH